MSSKKFVFTVQGEGRGHLTQAMAAYEILIAAGHQVSYVIVGNSSHRELPAYFSKKINAPVICMPSPNFTTDQHLKSIKPWKTLLDNVLKVGKYRKSLRILGNVLKQQQPDIVLNFYEPLLALYSITRKCSFQIVAIAHQYIYLHPHFRFPPNRQFQAYLLTAFTKFTAMGSSKQLALSMYDLDASRKKSLSICPPLLRRKIFDLSPIEEDFILVYLVNPGYAQEIIRYHKKHPETKLYCFTDSREVKEQNHGELRLNENLVFYSLNDQKFMDLMTRCKGLVCTAGFESVCEAMYLNKPVLMVPVKGHFEQFCNALDAARIGAGIYASKFDISKLNDCLLFYDKNKNKFYRDWVNSYENRFMEALDLAGPFFSIRQLTSSPCHPSHPSIQYPFPGANYGSYPKS